MAESVIQWVIEDDFIAGRPALEKAGVELVESVLPWEEAKIRILNATHAAIAWAGTLTASLEADTQASPTLAYWHLVRLAPAGKDIPYNPTGGKDELQKAAKAWRALIPRGKLPPKPKDEDKPKDTDAKKDK